MKKIYRFFFAAVAIASAASCSEQLDSLDNAGEGTVELVNMTFKAATDVAEDVESKTYGAGRNVYWESGDEITVFSIGDKVVKEGFKTTSVAEDNTWAQFSGLADPDAETYYAVYPHAEGNTYADGTFNATIPSEQVGRPNGFVSGSNVAVAVSTEGTDGTGMLQFKNLSAVIYFKFATAEDAANTKSVTLKARKSEDDAATPEFWGLTGDVKFTLDDNNLPVAQEGTVDHVTLLPPDGGFVSGKNYIIPVCPVGECKGMQIIFTDQNDVTYEKNNNTDFKLQRNIMFNNGGVPEPYEVPFPDEDFDVVLDFAEYPFNQSLVAPSEQKVETVSGSSKIYKGHDYTFSYKIEGEKVARNFETALSVSQIVDYYKHEDGALIFYSTTDDTSMISYGGNVKAPVIPNRYLCSIKVDFTNTDRAVTFRICDNFPQYGNNTYQTIKQDAQERSCTFVLPNSKFGSELNHVYAIGTRTRNVKITKITFTYSKTKPE